MRQADRKDGDSMSIIIENIIRIERRESDAFIKMQQKRLLQLKEIEQRKRDGKRIQVNRIVKELQASGILDENGNPSKHFYE